MAGTSLLALIDDIAAILDDVGVMAKVAAKKTAGVLGDDLALNAQQVTGLTADRELPVVWAVAKGSLRNKLVLVPAALIISALAPWIITPLLMFGGAFLCFEGFEKLAHKFLHAGEGEGREALVEALADPAVNIVAFEKEKIRGAVRTDFILSIEIIVITLGVVAAAGPIERAAVLLAVAIAMTAGVYGLVAAIVKLDDGGLYLSRKIGGEALSKAQRAMGELVLRAAPYLMKGLSIAGTAAMFMVGGSIVVHGIPRATELIHIAAHALTRVPGVGHALELLAPTLLAGLAGFFFGAVVFAFLWVARSASGTRDQDASSSSNRSTSSSY